MWSKEHKKLSRKGWSENEIQAHFKEREIIEYQRYNQATGKTKISLHVRRDQPCLTRSSDMQMDSPDPISAFAER